MKFRFSNLPLTSAVIAVSVLTGTGALVTAADTPRGVVRLLEEKSQNSDGLYPVTTIGHIDGATRIAVPEAGGHVLVLTDAGIVWAWGDNTQGQLGSGDTDPIVGWRPVEGMARVKAIAAGAGHSLALTEDGTVWAWGANFEGQLGDGTLLSRLRPQKVPGLAGIVSIAAGPKFSAALREDGTLLVFGGNWEGLAPAESDRILMRPVALPGTMPVAELAVRNGRVVSRERHQDRRSVPWTSNAGLARLVEWTEQGLVLREAGAIQQRIPTEQVLADLAAGWAVGWLEGGLMDAKTDLGKADTAEGLLGGALATPDLAIVKTAGGSFTVGSPAGYVLTVSNVGGAATAGTITVTDVLPAGLTYVAGSGAGWNCSAVGQTVTCTNPGPLSAGGSSVIYLHVGVGLPAYPSISNTATVSVPGDAGAANNSSTAVTAVAAKPTVQLTGAIAGGYYHSLRLAPDGKVWAAGMNSSGQLGDGTNVNRAAPVLVSGLTGLTAVAAASNHSVALKSDGTVWAWGLNSNGQLGDGTTVTRNLPQVVSGLSGVVAISARYAQTLALKSDGTVWGWGMNTSGQLGDGTTVSRATPVQVPGLSGIIKIAAGRQHTLALRMDGTVWSWGSNTNGRLGDGTSTNRLSPVQVSGLSGVVAIAAGYGHSMALKSDGTVWTWGSGSFGELGLGTSPNSQLLPTLVNSLTGVAAISAGYYSSMALLGDGTVWWWGFPTTSNVPVQVNGITGATSIDLGGWWTYTFGTAVKSDGTTWSWGDNSYGQLGTGSARNRALPVAVPGLSGVIAISAREYATLALKGDGSVWSWGNNSSGQLGDGTTVSHAVPVQASGVSNVKAVSSGATHGLAVKSDGTVWSWGDNSAGQLGDGTNTNRPAPAVIAGLTGVAKVAAGYIPNLAVKTDSTLWAWGANTHGEVGDGTTTPRLTPVQVPGLSGIVAAATGDYFSLALKNDGTVWSWGDNSSSQLGDGTTVQRLSPVQVLGLSGIVAISNGYRHGMALKNDGTVWVWGYTDGGGMGDGTIAAKSVPAQVPGLTGVVAISGGGQHCLALKNNGSVWAWGRNSAGQLGDGTTIDRWIPVPVALLSGVAGIAGGGEHSLALMADGTLRAWGSEMHGQVGDNAPASPASPVQSLPFNYPDLTISMTDGGSVPVGGRLTYTLTVTNIGLLSSSGTITVTDTLPAGLTYYSGSGSGWSCSASGQLVTCTRVTALSAGASSAITLQATVLSSAVPAVSNTATVANASDLNLDNNTTGDPLVVGITTGVGVTPSSGSGAQQVFQAVYGGSMGYQYLRWVQLLFATASDGGGQPFCFLHYDVTGNAFWLYSDVYGFFRGPVAPGVGSVELQGSQCALNSAQSSVSGSGSNLTLNLAVMFKAAATRNVYMRALDWDAIDTGWQQRGTWTQVAAPTSTLVVSPASGSGTNSTFALTFPDPPGFPASTLGWEQFLVAAAVDGGGQPFCFVHYDRAGNGLWMYSSDVGFFLGPVAPGTASTALDSTACLVNTAATTAQTVSGNLILTVPLTLKAPMSGVKNTYLRMMDPLLRDTGMQEKGTWTIP
jgi:uncharacterized repeat protein (TIGR01451 family)